MENVEVGDGRMIHLPYADMPQMPFGMCPYCGASLVIGHNCTKPFDASDPSVPYVPRIIRDILNSGDSND